MEQQPSPWLLQNLDLIPRGAGVLDVAAGRGRNALALLSAGCDVVAVDRDAVRLAALEAAAQGVGGRLTTRVADLEAEGATLGEARYDVVLVFNYLHRPLMPAIVGAVAAGGLLVYETFTIGQQARGHPRNPAFLLQPGELRRLVVPLRVLRSREGDFEGKCLASVVAVNA